MNVIDIDINDIQLKNNKVISLANSEDLYYIKYNGSSFISKKIIDANKLGIDLRVVSVDVERQAFILKLEKAYCRDLYEDASDVHMTITVSSPQYTKEVQLGDILEGNSSEVVINETLDERYSDSHFGISILFSSTFSAPIEYLFRFDCTFLPIQNIIGRIEEAKLNGSTCELKLNGNIIV